MALDDQTLAVVATGVRDSWCHQRRQVWGVGEGGVGGSGGVFVTELLRLSCHTMDP